MISILDPLKKYITIMSVSKTSSEILLQGGICKKPTLLIQRRPDEECYIEHIQDYFVVVRNAHHQSFEVFLINENDVFGNMAWLEGRGKGKGGLIDHCFDKKLAIPLTPSPNVSDSKISDSYRIIDMDIMEVLLRSLYSPETHSSLREELPRLSHPLAPAGHFRSSSQHLRTIASHPPSRRFRDRHKPRTLFPAIPPRTPAVPPSPSHFARLPCAATPIFTTLAQMSQNSCAIVRCLWASRGRTSWRRRFGRSFLPTDRKFP